MCVVCDVILVRFSRQPFSNDQHKQEEHSDLVLISSRLTQVQICVESHLNNAQARFDVRQDFFGDKMASFAPFCKGERLLPGHG